MPNRRYDEIKRPGKNLHRTSAAVSADSLALPTVVENLRKRLQVKETDWPARHPGPSHPEGLGARRAVNHPRLLPRRTVCKPPPCGIRQGAGLVLKKRSTERPLIITRQMEEESMEDSVNASNDQDEGSMLRTNQCLEGSMLGGINARRDQLFGASTVAQAPPVPSWGFAPTHPNGQKTKIMTEPAKSCKARSRVTEKERLTRNMPVHTARPR